MKQSLTKALVLPIFWLMPVTAVFSINADDWYDTFYQYRLPLVVDFPESGRNVVPIEETGIISAINRLEEMQYDSLWFDYNRLKVVEVDAEGHLINPNPHAGFYMMPQGQPLMTSSAIGKDKKVSVPTEAGTFYHVTYTHEPKFYPDVPAPARQRTRTIQPLSHCGVVALADFP